MNIEIFLRVVRSLPEIEAPLSRLLVKARSISVTVVDQSQDLNVAPFLSKLQKEYNFDCPVRFDFVSYGHFVLNALRNSTATYIVFVTDSAIVSENWLVHLWDAAVNAGPQSVIAAHDPGLSDSHLSLRTKNAFQLCATALENEAIDLIDADGSELPAVCVNREWMLAWMQMQNRDSAFFSFDFSINEFWQEYVTQTLVPFRRCTKSVVGNTRSLSNALPNFEKSCNPVAVNFVERLFGRDLLKGRLQNRCIVYLVPSLGGSGGAYAIVDEAVSMRNCGLDVRIAVPQAVRSNFLSFHPETSLFLIDLNIEDSLNPLASISSVDIIIATNYHSVRYLAAVNKYFPAALPMYYIQDYEPLFFSPEDSRFAEAIRSYSLAPKAINFAKSSWLCDLVEAAHGIKVNRIAPGVNRTIFNNIGRETRDKKSPVRITALVRPSTRRRAPLETLQALKQIKNEFRDRVDVRIFGCTDEDLDLLTENTSFGFVNLGTLLRADVARLLKGSDIFLDRSAHQALGLLGLEAMASGCATILPLNSGSSEYARNRENSLLVKTEDSEGILHALRWLVTNSELRSRLALEAVKNSSNFGLERTVWTKLLLFEKVLHVSNYHETDMQSANEGNAR